ncbi:MAG: 2-alkenal reductase, partial [Rhodothermia bacterium]|nr:2-alkenal reductase [Rhodothermia bacterium]
MAIAGMTKTRIAVIMGFALLCAGCGNNAQSQEQAIPPLPDERPTDLASLGDELTQSRQTAITRAVAEASPAVVSINVIEVRRVQVRDPFADWFSDPVFEQFFGRRRQRQVEQQVKGLGSGFVISP